MSDIHSLLMEIQRVVGCPYLSDLHSGGAPLNEAIRILLVQIPLERYTTKEWNDAAAYISGEDCDYKSPEEARNKILAGR